MKKAGPARQKKPKSRYFDGLRQCSGTLGIPKEVLSAAKIAGCPMFKGSRIYEAGLKDWIAEHHAEIVPAAGALSLRDQKLTEEVRKLRIQNDEAENRSIQRAEVIAAHSPILTKFKDAAYGKLVNEFPVYAAGQDTPTIRTMARKVADELVELLRGIGVEEWGER
jgi:hypothetical protein